MSKQDQRRLYDVKTFYGLLEDLLVNFGEMRAVMKGKVIDKGFSERVMLAVTQVNGCRYCSYFHTGEALKNGMSKAEVEALLNGEFGDAPTDELVALLFAQHYAETVGTPDHDAWQQVVNTYGPEKAKAILTAIRVIMVGNLHGNMIDALRSRLTGKPFPDSTIGQETGIVFGVLVFVPVIAVRQVFAGLFSRKKQYAWETYEVSPASAGHFA